MPQPLPRESETIIEAIDKYIEIKRLTRDAMKPKEVHAIMRSVWDLVEMMGCDLDALDADDDEEDEPEVRH